MLINAAQAATRLGLSKRQVQLYLKAGRIPAQRIGNQWVIDSADLDNLHRRKPGNPNWIKSP